LGEVESGRGPHRCQDLAMVIPEIREWSIDARNHPDHARNPIHTDVGAQAAGFPRALVAGVTTYAYLTHPVVVAWGETWLRSGGGEVRFRRPVFDKDTLRCCPVVSESGISIHALTDEPDQPRATFSLLRDAGSAPAMRAGTQLVTHHVSLVGNLADQYGINVGDSLPLYTENGWVHPAVWTALANDVVHTQIARGSWVHTRSIIRHHDIGHVGSVAEVRATVAKTFESHGERAVLDIHILIDQKIVASLEHEAIIALP